MSVFTIIGLVALVALAWLAASNANAAGVRVDDPAALRRTVPLGQRIERTRKRPVHILFVHGMRAEEPGAAAAFMKGLCRHTTVKCPPRRLPREFLPLGERPNATILGKLVWKDDADWLASRPFVDRYIFDREEGSEPVVVDEVNWWPLLFPLKCRMVVAPEGQLSGVDKKHLELCFSDKAPYHPWLTQKEFDEAMAPPALSGGGALVNRLLKREILNWGLADAVIALGPMRAYFRKAMEKAFEHAAAFEDRDVGGQEFVVVSESLGSFVVLDAAANVRGDSPKAREVVRSSSDLYFFANQFALLELGRIGGVPEVVVTNASEAALADAVPVPLQEPSPVDLLMDWAAAPAVSRDDAAAAADEAPVPAKQIIAFSDPSDMLTYRVPKLMDQNDVELAIVVNIYVRNATNWFGLAADPLKAHTGHSANEAVLREVFAPKR